MTTIPFKSDASDDRTNQRRRAHVHGCYHFIEGC